MRLLVFLLAMWLPLEAMALTCVRPSVARSYQEADAAAEAYVIVHGRLTFNARKLPKSVKAPNPPEMTRLPARLTGKVLGESGFAMPFERSLTLEVACFGPWCGNAETGQDVLAFVRRDADGYALAINPCGGHLFGNPDAAMMRQVRACYLGETCKADTP